MTSGMGYEIERSKIVFNKISTFDFGKVVQKYIKDYKVSIDTANDVLLELKRWFTLCVLHPEKPYVPGVKVDPMWHIFILFTKDYARFCQETVGWFIHHQPDVAIDDLEVQRDAADRPSDVTEMLEADYLRYFGSPAPGHIWGTPQKPQPFENAFRFLEAMARKEPEPGLVNKLLSK